MLRLCPFSTHSCRNSPSDSFRPIADIRHVCDPQQMNSFKIAAAILLLSGCSSPEEREREALMNLIEKQVQLPKGTRPLSEYARYYADTDSRVVVAVYLVPTSDEIGLGESCEELLENFASRKVSCEPMQFEWAMPAGERRWFKDKRDLPWINGGGCAQVEVEFDTATSTVKRAECNGEA